MVHFCEILFLLTFCMVHGYALTPGSEQQQQNKPRRCSKMVTLAAPGGKGNRECDGLQSMFS